MALDTEGAGSRKGARHVGHGKKAVATLVFTLLLGTPNIQILAGVVFFLVMLSDFFSDRQDHPLLQGLLFWVLFTCLCYGGNLAGSYSKLVTPTQGLALSYIGALVFNLIYLRQIFKWR